jgi:ABC-type glycerol-3-phosphate transport system permease component
MHVALLTLAAIFVVLYLRSPKRPVVALRYLRAVIIVLSCIVVLAPFVWLVAAVFKDKLVFNEYLFFPPLSEWSEKTMNLNSFRELFAGRPSVRGKIYFWQYVLNSTVYSTVGTVVQLFFASLTGYALAKFDFRGRRPLMIFMLGSMMIPSLLLLAPIYKMSVDIGTIDSLWGLILPGMVSAYGVFLFRQAMMSVPDQMLDAGRVDGCSEFAIYYRLAMPLVRPMSAAFCLISFLQHWNAFFAPNVFLHSQDRLTLPIVLRLYISQYQNEYGVFLAGTALAIIPPAILFLALQREFISGLTSGAVKG